MMILTNVIVGIADYRNRIINYKLLNMEISLIVSWIGWGIFTLLYVDENYNSY